MKQLNFTLLLLLCTFLAVNAQQTVQLNIHHKLGEADFAFNTEAQNNLGNSFILDRLEYYISEITLVHDGGQEIEIEDFWILVDASEETSIELGMFALENLEGIRFHIGVDPDHNHLDPASFPMGHPLAPQAPSMHWGWAAGYRFLAMEGESGSLLNQVFEIHGLGDANYYETNMEISPSVENDMLVVSLDADYTKILTNINVGSGLIEHGETGEAANAVKNLANVVFSPSNTSVGTDNRITPSQLRLYPNPAVNGKVRVEIPSSLTSVNMKVVLTNALGQQQHSFSWTKGDTQMELENLPSGLYWINLMEAGEVIVSKQLLVK